MKPEGFAADLYRKPEVLRRLAASLVDANPWAAVVPPDTERVVLLGMGSSAYAGGVAAARMRHAATQWSTSPQIPKSVASRAAAISTLSLCCWRSNAT